VRSIVAFNWPKLAGAGALVAAALALASVSHGAFLVASAGVALGAAYFLAASLAVSWWVYDRSDLHDWQWLRPLLADRARWVLVHAGFDDAGPGLAAALGPPAAVVDISPLLGRVSPSLRRARRRSPAPASALAVSNGRLPLATASCDAVVLVFAAHEVRDRRRREALFADLRRVVTASGRVILVEHLRDGANIAAFGPGAWHFLTRAEWLRLARGSRLRPAGESQLTAFVRALSLCPC
jgi:SAM-dependent methyltransferase